MSVAAASRRASPRERERHLVRVTRKIFDERGFQDAPIEQIARESGINKAVVYRHFSSKEELFVLTVTDYLDDLLSRAVDLDDLGDPEGLLRETCERFASFCLEYPAFLDCALSLMRHPAGELRERLSDSVWLRLGLAMAEALRPLAVILRAGRDGGVFAIEDPDFVANRLYTQVLGSMHLARVAIGVRLSAPGVPAVFALDPETVRRECVDDAMQLARVVPAGR